MITLTAKIYVEGAKVIFFVVLVSLLSELFDSYNQIKISKLKIVFG